MRKPLLILLMALFVTGLLIVGGTVYVRRDNAHQVDRAKALVRELRELEIDKSDYKAAEAIAAKFGSAPPPKGGVYPKENCAAGYSEGCWFTIAMNDSFVQRQWFRHPSLPRFGVHDWWGNAGIWISHGTVHQRFFYVWYVTSNGQWRGFGAREFERLPKYQPVQARISDSYSVERFVYDMPMNGKGFQLQSSLTPSATPTERQRASRLDFACLAQAQGCGEICEVMPDAWQDFYLKRGHLDAEQLGPEYLFCSKPLK